MKNKPRFLSTDEGSGKKVIGLLEKVFKKMEEARLIEFDYGNFCILDIEEYDFITSLLKEIDKELQEGVEWIIDNKKEI